MGIRGCFVGRAGSTAVSAGLSLLFLAALPVAARATTTPVTVTNGPDTNPFSRRMDLAFSSLSPVSQSFVVPTGERLVIDYVSGFSVLSGGSGVMLAIATISNGAEIESRFPMIQQGVFNGRSNAAASYPTKIFADSGSTVTIFAQPNAASGGMIVGLYGHFVPTP